MSSSSEQYARAALRVAVAQICQSFGFTRISPRALHALTDVVRTTLSLSHATLWLSHRVCCQVITYIDEIGVRSRQYAELAHRTESNFFDLGASVD
jgi:hypothetical protein